MNRNHRMELLKLAKGPKGQVLSGAKNQRSLQKFLDYARETYLKDSKELKRTMDEIARLENRRDELEAKTKKMRKDISEVYELIQVMGLQGAREVRIGDDGEVSYVLDGKLFIYDKASDKMIPRNQYRKEQLSAKEQKEAETSDENSVDESLEAKMLANDLNPEEEGIEFKKMMQDQEDIGW